MVCSDPIETTVGDELHPLFCRYFLTSLRTFRTSEIEIKKEKGNFLNDVKKRRRRRKQETSANIVMKDWPWKRFYFRFRLLVIVSCFRFISEKFTEMKAHTSTWISIYPPFLKIVLFLWVVGLKAFIRSTVSTWQLFGPLVPKLWSYQRTTGGPQHIIRWTVAVLSTWQKSF